MALTDREFQQLKRIADALDRAYPKIDASFSDPGTGANAMRRLSERPAYTYATTPRNFQDLFRGEGDHLLHDDGHEGEDID